jgi:hypothetical protein
MAPEYRRDADRGRVVEEVPGHPPLGRGQAPLLQATPDPELYDLEPEDRPAIVEVPVGEGRLLVLDPAGLS